MDWEALTIRLLSKLAVPAVSRIFQGAATRESLKEGQEAIDRWVELGLLPTEYRRDAGSVEVKFAEDVDRATTAETIRLVTNLLETIDKAKSLDDVSELAFPGDEFMRRWTNDACNESDETLQEMWARVLRGGMTRSGPISKHTHSIIRELTPEVAKNFQSLCSLAMCGMDGKRPIMVSSLNPTAVLTDTRDMETHYGLRYDQFLELVEFRLLSSPLEGSFSIPLTGEEPRHLTFLVGSELWILEIPALPGMDVVSIPGIYFSSAGKELFPVVERFEPTTYMNALDKYFTHTWEFTVKRAPFPLWSPDRFGPEPESWGSINQGR